MLNKLKSKYPHKSCLNDRIVLIHADCFDVINDIDKDSVDLVFQDPPYKFGNNGGGMIRGTEKTYKIGMKRIGTDKDTNIYTQEFLYNIERISKNINYFHFCNKAQIKDLLDFSYKKKYCFDIVVLCKTNPVPFANNVWLMDREFGFHIHRKLKPSKEWNYKRGWYSFNNNYSSKINHPCPKPLFLCKNILLNISKKDELVFDGFLGSGTTALACIEENRRCIGVEIYKDYFDISCKRIENYLKQGSLFEKVK
jgi:DNA modification methylase